MIKSIINLFVKSPFYPHWLEHIKMHKANEVILSGIHGDVLEVGAGDGTKKEYFLKKYKDIRKYIATDYSSWDLEFKKMNEKADKLNGAGSIFFGYKKRVELDVISDAMNLNFKNESFDYHLSFEVLEHINDPNKFFREATRVLRKEGNIIFSVPFLYRMHGGEPNHKIDFFRYANGFFYKVAKDNNLQVSKIYSNTGFGTTFASLLNQWIIRRIFESNIIIKIIFLVISPFVFFISNITGYVIDIFPDKRFATRFHVSLKK